MKPKRLPAEWLRLPGQAKRLSSHIAPRNSGANGSQMGRAVVPTDVWYGWARPLGATGMGMAGEKPKAPGDARAGARKHRADTSLDAGFDRFIERQLTRMYGDILNEPLPEDIERLLNQVPSGSLPDGEEKGS
jgi:hypothetical protein